MTTRERLSAILDGKAPDRIPWIPRMQIWYKAHTLAGTLPNQWRGWTLRQIERELGLGTPARDAVIASQTTDGVEVLTRADGDRRITEYRTPAGSVRQVEHHSEEYRRLGLGATVVEYFLKTPADYAVWEWIVEHTSWQPTFDLFHSYDREIGDDGLPMASMGDVPFHRFAQDLAGYEGAYFQLADYPREVEHLLSVMEEVERDRMWPVVAQSPARLILHGSHLSSQFTPPSLFRRYILPYYRDFSRLLHKNGKSLVMHGDNDTSAILKEIEEAGWDMVECFATAPMAKVTLADARAAWGSRVIIRGGLPSALLSPSVDEEEFRSHVRRILQDIAPGDAFVLGVSDNVMPDSLIDRIRWVSDLLEERGWYPIETG
jgi:hypothetical protein